MPVTELNHYFVRANDLERSHRFYCDVLGFEDMARPTFPFPGYWLGVNGKVQVHMGPHGIAHSELYYLGTTPKSAPLNCRKRYLPEFRLFQMFVEDPDGLTIELNFHGVDNDPAWTEGSENYADIPKAT